MKEFPECNFVIKPGNWDWLQLSDFKNENIYNLFIIRDPRIGWITNTKHIDFNVNKFIENNRVKERVLKKFRNVLKIVKIEKIGKNKLMNQLIKPKTLKRVKPFIKFDIILTEQINCKTIFKELN